MAAFTAIAGLTLAVGSTAMSFAQAGKQSKLQKEAEASAAEAMAEARKKLEVNFSENLSIQKEPYELEREALLSQGALSLQAGVESDRGAEATAGRIQMAQNAAQAGVRGSMGQEMMNIEQKIIDEDNALRDSNLALDLGEVSGAQLAARDAQKASVAATNQGFQSLASVGQQAINMSPLFKKAASAKVFDQIKKGASLEGLSTQGLMNNLDALGSKNPQFSYLSGIGKMNSQEAQSVMTNLGVKELNAIYSQLNYGKKE